MVVLEVGAVFYERGAPLPTRNAEKNAAGAGHEGRRSPRTSTSRNLLGFNIERVEREPAGYEPL